MALVYRDYTCVSDLVASFSDSRPRIEKQLAGEVASFLTRRIETQLAAVRDAGRLTAFQPEESGYAHLADAYMALGGARSAVDAVRSQFSAVVVAAARTAVEQFVKGALQRVSVATSPLPSSSSLGYFLCSHMSPVLYSAVSSFSRYSSLCASFSLSLFPSCFVSPSSLLFFFLYLSLYLSLALTASFSLSLLFVLCLPSSLLLLPLLVSSLLLPLSLCSHLSFTHCVCVYLYLSLLSLFLFFAFPLDLSAPSPFCLIAGIGKTKLPFSQLCGKLSPSSVEDALVAFCKAMSVVSTLRLSVLLDSYHVNKTKE